jgi:hypothetical protein
MEASLAAASAWSVPQIALPIPLVLVVAEHRQAPSRNEPPDRRLPAHRMLFYR